MKLAAKQLRSLFDLTSEPRRFNEVETLSSKLLRSLADVHWKPNKEAKETDSENTIYRVNTNNVNTGIEVGKVINYN